MVVAGSFETNAEGFFSLGNDTHFALVLVAERADPVAVVRGKKLLAVEGKTEFFLNLDEL